MKTFTSTIEDLTTGTEENATKLQLMVALGLNDQLAYSNLIGQYLKLETMTEKLNYLMLTYTQKVSRKPPDMSKDRERQGSNNSAATRGFVSSQV
jgi:hypothetical protein